MSDVDGDDVVERPVKRKKIVSSDLVLLERDLLKIFVQDKQLQVRLMQFQHPLHRWLHLFLARVLTTNDRLFSLQYLSSNLPPCSRKYNCLYN